MKILLAILVVLCLNSNAAPLVGQYTIGGTSPDYATFTAAFADLTSQGVGGPVEFIVRAGTYTEQVVLGNIPGSSIANQVVFHSELMDSSTVTLTNASGAAATNNYTMLIDGADYVSFMAMTFERSGTNSFSTVVELANAANNITFSHNVFVGPSNSVTTNTDGSRSGIFSGDLTSNDSLVVSNNRFVNNANGIWSNGNALGNQAKGTLIEDNTFNTFYVGVFLLYQEGPVIHGNVITRNDSLSTVDFYGISIRYCIGTMLIVKNKVIAYKGNYGIRFRDCNGYVNSPGLTINNFVQVGDATAGRGIGLEDDCFHQKLMHNSVNCFGSATGRALYIDGSGTGNIQMFNNIWANTGGGYSAYISSNATSGLSASNNNCFYSTGSSLAYYFSPQATLTNWQAITGKDGASYAGSPNYTTAYDLHANAAILDNHGFTSGIPDDIDGDARNATTPDIGADEFVFSAILENGSGVSVVAPNPFTDKTEITFSSLSKGEYIFRLTDMQGKEMMITTVNGNTIVIERKGLTSGTYIYCVYEKDGMKRRVAGKLVID